MRQYWSYDSLSELVSDAMRRTPAYADNHLARHETDMGAGWMCSDRRHIRDFASAARAMSEPLFPAGVARIERLTKLINAPTPVSIRRRVVRGAEGDELSMQHVWQGDLDHAWSRAKRQHTVAASRVLINVFVGAPSGESSEGIAWRGVAALALADALEAGGYTVAIRAMRRSSLLGRGNHDVDVTIKPEGEPLDLHKAASLIASTLLFRGVLLRHAVMNCETLVGGGISSTSYERQDDVRDAQGFDACFVAGREISNARAASDWVSAAIASLDERNGLAA